MPILPIPARSASSLTISSPAPFRRASASISHTTTSLLALMRRQTTTVVPAYYSNIGNSQSPGTIIGIVLGAVGGFLLLLWLLYTLAGGNISGSASVDVERVVVRETKHARRGGSSKRTSRVSRETVDVRRAPAPPPPVVIVEERERRESRPIPVAVSSAGSSDEVVVIEEHSPPRRKPPRETRPESGYRTVDPLAYGGGDRPLRDVERRGSRRSNRD